MDQLPEVAIGRQAAAARPAWPAKVACGGAPPGAMKISWPYGLVTDRTPDLSSWAGDPATAADLVYADVPQQRYKMLGSLPVAASFCRRLGIAEVIDDLAPIRDVAAVTAGQAGGTSAVAVQAITEFGIDIGQLHWDMTSLSLHGAYDDAGADYPAPRYGHPKDRRPDLLQIQAGIAAAGDGGIPVWHHAYDGGAAEVSQVTGAMTALKKIAGTRTFLLIGDSNYVAAAELAACQLEEATEVAYVAQRDAGKRPDQIGRWHPTHPP